MRRFAFAVILLAALLVGCASNKIVTEYKTPEGKVYKTVSTDMTDSATFHYKQADLKEIALLNQKPLVKIVIPEGATLKAEGGNISIEAYVPVGKELAQINQYREPWLEGAGYAAPVLTALGMAHYQNELIKSMAALDIGGRYSWNNSFNGNSNSPAAVANGSGWTMPTTITTTSNSTTGAQSPIGNNNWAGPRDNITNPTSASE